MQELLTLPEMNECFLFHGTNKKDAILNQGIDYRLGNQRALFGQGCYFAESSTKADQYAGWKFDKNCMCFAYLVSSLNVSKCA